MGCVSTKAEPRAGTVNLSTVNLSMQEKERMFTNYCQAKNIEKASLIDQQEFFI